MNKIAEAPLLIATLGIMLFSMMDAVMKGQALAMGTYNAMFWRMLMGAICVSLLYLPTRPIAASGRVLKIHIIRATLTAVMAYLFFYGLTRIPLAQAIGLSFIAPDYHALSCRPVIGRADWCERQACRGIRVWWRDRRRRWRGFIGWSRR